MDLLIGGPGTGKTTTLVNKIRELKPEKFALLSFTRQAANEAKSRLSRLYNDRQLEWVRTIHSLAFKCLRLNRGSMFTDNHLKEFGNEYGFEFRNQYYMQDEDGTFEQLTKDEITYRKMIIFETLGESLDKVNYLEHPDTDFDALAYMFGRYMMYKHTKNLLDFNDILKLCVTRQLPKFDLLCVDEAQDLSPLQFALVDRLCLNSRHVIFAGDDDQMIYEWAGVKRSLFMELADKCNLEILVINHRLTKGIINKSQQIINKCKSRINKPSNISKNVNELSSIQRISDLYEIDKFDPFKTYLILVRNNWFLKDIRLVLEDLGLFWSYLKHRDKSSSNIKISTIHGSKGAEADIVILFTDVTNSTYQHITSDAEHRVWYVAMTRTKNKLIIVDSQSKFNYEI